MSTRRNPRKFRGSSTLPGTPKNEMWRRASAEQEDFDRWRPDRISGDRLESAVVVAIYNVEVSKRRCGAAVVDARKASKRAFFLARAAISAPDDVCEAALERARRAELAASTAEDTLTRFLSSIDSYRDYLKHMRRQIRGYPAMMAVPAGLLDDLDKYKRAVANKYSELEVRIDAARSVASHARSETSRKMISRYIWSSRESTLRGHRNVHMLSLLMPEAARLDWLLTLASELSDTNRANHRSVVASHIRAAPLNLWISWSHELRSRRSLSRSLSGTSP